MNIKEAKEYLASVIFKESRVVSDYSKKIKGKLSKIKKIVLNLEEKV